MTPISINTGTLPAVDPQVDNSRLSGGFINPKNHIQLLPNLLQIQALADTRAIFQSFFNDRLIIATNDDIFYLENEILVEVSTIIHSDNAIRMAENAQGQVCIVNGEGAWVFDQANNSFFQLQSTLNGFDLTNPTDVTSLDTFLVVVGGTEKKWIASNANDATTWDGNEVIETDSTLGDLVGVEMLDNNLFIFGTGGVERWIPSIERIPNSFPFSQDPTYQDEYGCISTASLVSQNNQLFYLSTNGQVRMMTPQSHNTITNDGIEEIINNYTDQDKSFGNYFYHKGHFLYQLTFVTNKNAFVFCPDSKKWSESADLLLGVSGNPILTDGVYVFNTDYTTAFKEIFIQTPYVKPKISNLHLRAVLGSVFLEMTQGKSESADTQSCFLQLSKDNIVFGNKVRRLFSKVGDRLFQFRWYMNFTNTGFSLRFTLQTKQDITITSAWFNLS